MPDKVRKRTDHRTEIDEEQGSIWSMLITFAVMVLLTVLICTIVWKVTHKEPKAELGNMQVNVNPTIVETLVASDELGGGEEEGAKEIEIDPVNGDSTMYFEQVEEDVTAKDAAIIRIQPNTEGIVTVAGQLRNGQYLKRTGINKETGWSRVIFDGKECFAITYLLTTDKEYKTKAPENPDNRIVTSDGYIVLFRDCDDLVTVSTQQSVNLRTEPSTAGGGNTVKAQLKGGITAKRTGYSIDAGWSRVEYDGLVLYVVTNFIKEVSE